MTHDPSFFIGDVPIYGDVILAPMAGYADVPHRSLCRSFGSALNYTEFVAVEEVLNGTKAARSKLDFTTDERPMVLQLFGNDSKKFLEAALRVEELAPDIVDINMGCSTRRVSGRGAGVGLMPQPEVIHETFDLLCRNLALPVTGKIRLGWQDEINYIEVGRIMEDSGASMIAIHPRTKEQGYQGIADWDAIAQLKLHVAVPIVGSGDVTSPDDIDNMRQRTGCDAVMVGRGAIGNPWIFSRVDKRTVPREEVHATIRQHLSLMLDYHGGRGLILFRKYLKKYLDQESGIEEHIRRMLITEDAVEFLMLLDKIDDIDQQ